MPYFQSSSYVTSRSDVPTKDHALWDCAIGRLYRLGRGLTTPAALLLFHKLLQTIGHITIFLEWVGGGSMYGAQNEAFNVEVGGF